MRKIIYLILSIIFAFLLEIYLLNRGTVSASFVTNNLAFSTDNLLSGRVWTTVTALFVHASFLHLFGNMLFLFIFGMALEREVGSKRTIGLFFLGGVLTFLFGIPFYARGVPLIGASAAIFTLSSAIMLIHPTKLTITVLPVGLVAILFFLLNVFSVATGQGGNVAYISHVIGFLIGIPFGIIWSRSPVRNLVITILMLLIFLLIVYVVSALIVPIL